MMGYGAEITADRSWNIGDIGGLIRRLLSIGKLIEIHAVIQEETSPALIRFLCEQLIVDVYRQIGLGLELAVASYNGIDIDTLCFFKTVGPLIDQLFFLQLQCNVASGRANCWRGSVPNLSVKSFALTLPSLSCSMNSRM